ncbi:YggS family pyridoxal phosphate-dependent enzyme [Methylovorus sp. MP688]|uniref:YggS family pyridoxal phosphate-dependent enzyme n=1 Tax=Methylovorus sp. (strain MP688) TaxID=887061 RepID=UPI0001EC4488|nr:YggS family pyridoxal phosphate-dependent enzyme [Methylovorus sp. MP688]ADQ83830.1 alanine racemase domain protein [Methylovorus sp. MP688]
MSAITERLQAVQARICQSATAAGRDPQEITLLAVSKAQNADAIRDVWAAGQQRFGENYLQEALNKQSLLQDLPIEWHFIGPIQSNKTQPIAQHFSWVHGVDRLKIAERLNAARPAELPPLQICLQVNVSHEESKSGIAPEEAYALASAITQLPRLQLRGLMAIPAPTPDMELQRAQFRMVRALYDALRQQGIALDTLSIGMSEDFPVAIGEGATIVRVGSAIFGPRPAKAETA